MRTGAQKGWSFNNLDMLVVASNGLYEDRTRSNTWGLILSLQIYFSYSRMMDYKKTNNYIIYMYKMSRNHLTSPSSSLCNHVAFYFSLPFHV
jgi:hypothetical protein